MNLLDIILIGIALAMDAFALTLANCTVYKANLNMKKEWSMPIAFAIFQFLMPVIGFYVGSLFAKYIQGFAKYITAGIFFLLSAKIVFDKVKEILHPEEDTAGGDFTYLILIIQAIATSIDALFVGVTFAVELTMSIFIASLIIGAVTFVIVAIALVFGKFIKKALKNYAEWFGVVILLALAIKNLF